MNKNDYESVLDNMRLSTGELWPIPITLDMSKNTITSLNLNSKTAISLRDKEGFLIAIMKINDIWQINKEKEATAIYKTKNLNHPGVNYLYNNIKDYYVGGTLKKVQLPHHYDYQLIRHTPFELKTQFKKSGWKDKRCH